MYPRIENSVRWSAHPESRTDRPRAAASRGRGAWGLGALTPRMGGGGARSRPRIPQTFSTLSSHQIYTAGRRNSPPPRPLFSRTPSPALNARAQRHHRRADRRRRVWQPVYPFIMQRQQWAMDMAMDESRLPPGAHGAGSYSSHPNDSTGTWAGDAAVISQIDAFRAFRSQ